MSLPKKEKLHDILKVIQSRLDTRFFKTGLPFFLLVVGGSFGLKYFTSIRYEYKQDTLAKREAFEEAGIEMKKPEEVTIEAIYEEVKKLDIDNWTNIRGPRPWEEEPEQRPRTKQ